MSEQEEFWRGEFGTAYTERNRGDLMLASNIAFFAKALSRTRGIGSVLELGANRGMNLSALRRLLPNARLEGVEINAEAYALLSDNPDVDEAHHASLLNGRPLTDWDLVVTKGVLIHLAPEDLMRAYEVIYQASLRYILIAEYHAATPTEVNYRGHERRLWRRDFASEMLDAYPTMINRDASCSLDIVDYGFCWARDPMWPQDSLVWTLLEKR